MRRACTPGPGRRGQLGRACHAHLRRNVHLLDWVGKERGGAAVRLGRRSLGTWNELGAQWSFDGSTLKLRFREGARVWHCEVLSASLRVGGADVHCRFGARRRAVLALEWEQQPDRPDGPFETTILQWLRRLYAGASILHIARRTDLSRSLSGRFLRVLLRDSVGDRFVVAAPSDCTTGAGEALTQALLWTGVSNPHAPARITLIVPHRMAQVSSSRCDSLDPAAVRVEVFQYDSDTAAEDTPFPAGCPPEPVEERDFRWPLKGPFRESAMLVRVLDLAPNLIRRHPCFRESDSLRLWGLEFARASGGERERVLFGIGPGKTELVDDNFSQLAALVEEILYFRRADSPVTDHPLYRAQAERWMESLILDDVERLLPELCPNAVHSQVPVYLGDEAGRADMIGVDREGTLVVLELKASADPGLPMQALDYHRRVHRHNLAGDFLRRGYFSGLSLSSREPKIYLVAPVFAFHDSTERLVRNVHPETEIWKIAINEDWRSGIEILARRRLAGGTRG